MGALAEELHLSLKTLTRNLRLLKRAGLLRSDPRGTYVYYRLHAGGAVLRSGRDGCARQYCMT